MAIGKAYGFFGCSKKRQDIEIELPLVRQLTQTPSELELLLLEELGSYADAVLSGFAQEAKQNGSNFILSATYPAATNKQAADELADLFVNLSRSSLYEGGESFYGDIVYEEAGRYLVLGDDR